MHWLTDRFPSRRAAYAFGFLLCAGLLAYAFYLQYVLLMEPCPMCWFQRAAFLALGLVFLAGAIVGPGERGARVLAWGVVLTAGIGALLAARHLWIQSLPADQLPSCGMGIGYMLDTLPFLEVLGRALKGSVECNQIDLVLGLPIPAWNLGLFLIAILAAFSLIRHRSS